VQNGYTFVVDFKDCYFFFLHAISDDLSQATAAVFTALGKGAASAINQQVQENIKVWCEELAKASPSPP
jgi:hypothetical protein